ncbi:MAG: hypothetical protein Q9220_005051 [cf. Caloplaca sp. 1 TL-2023]
MEPVLPEPEGEVDNIDPAMETIIAILARRPHEYKIIVHLELAWDLVPGIVIMPDQDEVLFVSMDVPNIIEKWRSDYTLGSDARPIDILWKVESFRQLFIEKRTLITRQGWDILTEEEAEFSWGRAPGSPAYDPWPSMRATLRRKKLTGPLMAAYPNPYGYRTPSPVTEWQEKAWSNTYIDLDWMDDTQGQHAA